MIGASSLTIIKILIGLRDKSIENILSEKSLGDSQSKYTWVRRTIKNIRMCSYYSFKDKNLQTIKVLTQPMVGRNVPIIHNNDNMIVMS